MNKLVVEGFCAVVGVELIAIVLLPDRWLVPWVAGAALAVVLLAVRMAMGDDVESAPTEPMSNDPEESLRRWLSRTEILIRWSESTRTDWDRHLRPRLAREFATATSQRQAKNAAAFQAAGRMLFGTELWQWVDPENVARTGQREPGPGRAALEEILQRLERV